MDYTAFMETLRKKGYTPYFAKTSAEARDFVMNELLKGVKTLGKGGSVTLQETGIWDALLNQDEITLYSTTLAAMRGESKEEALQKAMFADCYICSANAITLQGDIVNICLLYTSQDTAFSLNCSSVMPCSLSACATASVRPPLRAKIRP